MCRDDASLNLLYVDFFAEVVLADVGDGVKDALESLPHLWSRSRNDTCLRYHKFLEHHILAYPPYMFLEDLLRSSGQPPGYLIR